MFFAQQSEQRWRELCASDVFHHTLMINIFSFAWTITARAETHTKSHCSRFLAHDDQRMGHFQSEFTHERPPTRCLINTLTSTLQVRAINSV